MLPLLFWSTGQRVDRHPDGLKAEECVFDRIDLLMTFYQLQPNFGIALIRSSMVKWLPKGMPLN